MPKSVEDALWLARRALFELAGEDFGESGAFEVGGLGYKAWAACKGACERIDIAREKKRKARWGSTGTP